MHLSAAGRMVEGAWRELPQRFPFVRLDAFVVMPDHFHGIVWLVTLLESLPRPLGQVIGAFKSLTTVSYIRAVEEAGWPRFDGQLWQRGYWERVIRRKRDLAGLRRYIEENPRRGSS